MENKLDGSFKVNQCKELSSNLNSITDLKEKIFEDVEKEHIDEKWEMYRSLVPPPNPIIDMLKEPDQQINMKLIDTSGKKIRMKSKNYVNILRKSLKNEQPQNQSIDRMTLFNGYDAKDLLYRRFDNQECNQLNKKRYFSSIFSPLHLRENMKFQMSLKIPQFQGMKKQKDINTLEESMIQDLEDELYFDSNFESGNLFAVFKTGHFTYDLVLQNDMNTTGCTQWFYFTVKNGKNKNITAKFNIVNLYKTSSLYNHGMKPVVFSQVSGKGWRRRGENIFYDKNDIHKEGTKKYYSSLSFTYDFIKANDTVHFAHSIPYTYGRLMELLKKIEPSKKCRIKSLGMTPLKKTIPIVKFQNDDPKVEKRAIIFIARQHPGEVQGSFLIEQILLNFLKPSSQTQFLLWRFNIYIVPMVNIDGVCLGNYRCNSMGFDLNRNWQGQQKSKHPEVVYIKNEIKKIMSKQPIELIIDFHGHSNKMNSFFYGNPFGPNHYVLPFAAAKTSHFVTFEDCTFNIEKKQKAKTARSVLGNMIKDTGNVYTYQISFYGGIKNEKVINFNQDSFRELGREVLSAIYKISIEAYKQQKVLKESTYLKSLRKEISIIQSKMPEIQDRRGSDSEAEEERDAMEEQRKVEFQEKFQELFDSEEKINFQLNLQGLKNTQNQKINLSDRSLNRKKYSNHRKKLSELYSSFNENLNMNKSIKPYNIDTFVTIDQKNESLEQKLKRRFFDEKLQIFGGNCFPQSNHTLQLQNTQGQSIKVLPIFDGKRQESLRIDFVIKTRNNRNHQNFSTLSPTKNQWKDENASIKDIVKVNRLEYKKIQRNKDRIKEFKKNLQKKSQTQGVFRLPSIANNLKI